MTLRIIAVGAGRAFERLYVPALALVPGLALVAVADPDPLARARVAAGVLVRESLEELLATEVYDGVVVLSPPPLHAAHATLALERRCPVLLEKPSARSRDEIASWPEAWRALVTPARPRRYWREYLRVRRELRRSETFNLVLQTSPAGWGARAVSRPSEDLFPHVLDLAGWLSRSPVVATNGSESEGEASGEFELADGRRIRWRVAHGDRYDEHVRSAGAIYNLSGFPVRALVARRIHGRPMRDVEGVARMLGLWERRLRGEPVVGLPDFGVATGELSAREALRPEHSEAGARAQLDRGA